MFKNVIVGTDGGQGGRDAVALARRLVEPGGMITLVRVYAVDADSARNAATDDAKETLALEVFDRALAHTEIDADLRAGSARSPGQGLLAVADESGADLLVVGSSRRRLVDRVRLADDSHAALNGAPCAVAIAPTGYAHQAGTIRKIGVGYNESVESEAAVRCARELASNTTPSCPRSRQSRSRTTRSWAAPRRSTPR
jgi:nucleotide-binding universal stress UspA family protein